MHWLAEWLHVSLHKTGEFIHSEPEWIRGLVLG